MFLFLPRGCCRIFVSFLLLRPLTALRGATSYSLGSRRPRNIFVRVRSAREGYLLDHGDIAGCLPVLPSDCPSARLVRQSVLGRDGTYRKGKRCSLDGFCCRPWPRWLLCQFSDGFRGSSVPRLTPRKTLIFLPLACCTPGTWQEPTINSVRRGWCVRYETVVKSASTYSVVGKRFIYCATGRG